ncbi:MAG: PTS sugar transporter subunit IIA [Thermodesulfobacteriota bacterium]|nr:PTS sugar transporter subunit IIA [Thermodesulfobacteriota bacterium]
MKITEILGPGFVIADIQARTKKDILTELASPIADKYSTDLSNMVSILLNREKLGSTGIGDGVAIPHGRVTDLSTIASSIGISHEGLKFDALDGKPCYIFFLLIVPGNSSSGHLKALARASILLKDPVLRQNLIASEDTQEIYRLIQEKDMALGE